MRRALYLLIAIVLTYTLGLTAPSLSVVTAGGPIRVSITGFETSGNITVSEGGTVNWYNSGLVDITLESTSGSPWTVSLPAGENNDRVFTASSTYRIKESPSHTATVTVVGESVVTKGTVTPTSIGFSWTEVEGAAGYDVYRGSYKMATQTGRTYTDTAVQPSNTYTYKVIDTTFGTVSNTITVLSPPMAPVELTATVTGSNATLGWISNQNSDDIEAYHIYLDGSEVGSTATGKTYRFTVYNLVPGTKYSYTVRSEDDKGQISADSNTATVLIKATATPSPTPKTSPGTTTPTPTATANPDTPELIKIVVDDQEFTPTPTNVLKLTLGKTINLQGTAKPDTTLHVSVYSSKKTTEVVTDKDGKWTVAIDTAGLEAGNHHIAVATVGSDGKAGNETTLLQFTTVTATVSPSLSTTDAKNWDAVKTAASAAIMLAVLGIIASAFALYRQNKKKKLKQKKAKEETKPVKEEETADETDSEDTEESENEEDPHKQE